jgi:hypothetical protein
MAHFFGAPPLPSALVVLMLWRLFTPVVTQKAVRVPL